MAEVSYTQIARCTQAQSLSVQNVRVQSVKKSPDTKIEARYDDWHAPPRVNTTFDELRKGTKSSQVGHVRRGAFEKIHAKMSDASAQGTSDCTAQSQWYSS